MSQVWGGGTTELFVYPRGKFGWQEPPRLGEEVEVVGKVNLFEKQLMLVDAAVTKLSPAPAAIEIDAVRLYSEVTADPQAAMTRYDGKVLKVTGVPYTQGTRSQIPLAGVAKAKPDNVPPVLCQLMGSQQGKLMITPGTPITLTGIGRFLPVRGGQEGQRLFVLGHCGTDVPVGSGTPGGSNLGNAVTPSGQPVATLTPDELIRNVKKYEGKYVVVSGKADADVAKDDLVQNLALQKTDAKRIDFRFGFTTFMPVEVKKGQTVELWGKVDQASGDKSVSLGDVELLTPAPEMNLSELIDAYMKDGAAADKKYSGSRWRFTGKVVAKTDFGLWVLEERPGTPPVQVEVALEESDTDRVRAGNTITFYASMPGAGLRRENGSVKFSLTVARLAPTTVPPGPK